jgi:putative ABC transport system permease protein
MALPISYNVRNLVVRWKVTLLAIVGIALVVSVFVVLLSMREGFQTALRSTGREDNAIIVQRGSGSELTSWVPQDQRLRLEVDQRVARGQDGAPQASPEVVVVMNLPRVTDGQPSNVTVRGVTPRAFAVRGGIDIVQGRSFTPGLDEIIVGERILTRVRGLSLGGTVHMQKRDWTIVGIFRSRGGAFESEIWGDYDVMGPAFQRTGGCNALVVRLADPSTLAAFDREVRNDPAMQLHVVQERKYYDDQAGTLATMIAVLAGFVSIVMGIGAAFGAMNTMYAIVAARTREIGTLRALGFPQGSILLSFVMESVVLALVGGVLGCLLGIPANGFTSGTGQTQSFSEVAFAFRVTPQILGLALTFAVVMGLVGGLLPALRAARLPITSALRES